MANKKITELTEVSSFTSDGDLIPIVINTDTVPSNASISKANLQTAIIGGGSFVTLDTAQTISGEKTFNADINFTGERYIYFEDGQYLEISDINGDNYIAISNDLVDVNGKAFSIFSTTSANGVYTDGAANDPLIIDARENYLIFELGTNGNRVTPNIGDVLVCTDTSGKVEWQSGGGKDNLTTANISGATNLDWNFTVHKLTATAAVTFSDINLPAHPKTITIYLTGAFPITVPSEWNLDLADYDGSVYNRITIDYVESGFYSADLKVLS